MVARAGLTRRSPGREHSVGNGRWRASRLALLPWLLGVAAALAQATDPLKSPACGQATQELEAARAAAGPDARQAASIEQLRRKAARICLGAGADRADAKPPARVAKSPETVPAPVIAVPRTAPPATAQAPAGPVQIARPQPLGNCDAGGCWDSNGTRLNRAGPNLIGPNGPCTVQGNFANCP